jgi:hypothetical protein
LISIKSNKNNTLQQVVIEDANPAKRSGDSYICTPKYPPLHLIKWLTVVQWLSNRGNIQMTETTATESTIDTSKESTHYLSSADFFAAIIESRIEGKISNKLAMMFVLLAERNVNHRNFVRYHHIRADLVQTGQLEGVIAFEKFRPFKSKEDSDLWEENKETIEYHHDHCSNSFAYFTTCIRHALIKFLKSEYNESNIINKTRLDSGLDASYGYLDMMAEQEARDNDESDESEHEMFAKGVEGMAVWDQYESEDSSVVEHMHDEESEERY